VCSKRRADRAEPAFAVVLEYIGRKRFAEQHGDVPLRAQRERLRQHGRIA
jgi:hypothetical protein